MIMWVQLALQYVANLGAQDAVCWKDLTNLTGGNIKKSTFIQENASQSSDFDYVCVDA
jgi:hypothetical protein